MLIAPPCHPMNLALMDRARPLFKLTPESSLAALGGTYSGAAVGTYVDANGIVQNRVNGVWRNNHWINGVRSTLLEGTRANLAVQCRTLTGASYSTVTASVTTNQVGTDGAANAATFLKEDATAGVTHSTALSLVKAASALPHTFAFDVKPNGRTIVQVAIHDGTLTAGTVFPFTLTGNGAAGAPTNLATPFTSTSSRIEALQGANAGWYRCFCTATTNVAVVIRSQIYLATTTVWSSGAIYNGDNTSGVILDFLSLEQAPFPSSRIATTASAVTRAADALSFPFGPVPQAMTVYASAIDLGTYTTTSSAYASVGSSASGESFQILRDSATNSRAQHSFGSAVVANTAATLAFGQGIEIRGVMNPDGSVISGVSIASGAEIVAGPSAGLALGASFQGATLYINWNNSTPVGFAAFQSIKVLSGIQSLNACRSA